MHDGQDGPTTPLGWARCATPRMRQAEVILFAYWAGRKGRADAEQELFWVCNYNNDAVNRMLHAVDVLKGGWHQGPAKEGTDDA